MRSQAFETLALQGPFGALRVARDVAGDRKEGCREPFGSAIPMLWEWSKHDLFWPS